MRTVLATLSAVSLGGCATPAAPGPAAGSAIIRLGQQERLGGLTVRALRIEEDSRCPRSVQCIQAGTMRLAVRLTEGGRSREVVLRPSRPEPLAGGRFVWLAGACPYPAAPGRIAPSAYYFLIAAGANITETPLDFQCAPD